MVVVSPLVVTRSALLNHEVPCAQHGSSGSRLTLCHRGEDVVPETLHRRRYLASVGALSLPSAVTPSWRFPHVRTWLLHPPLKDKVCCAQKFRLDLTGRA